MPARSIVGKKEKQTVAFLVIASFIERAAPKYLNNDESIYPNSRSESEMMYFFGDQSQISYCKGFNKHLKEQLLLLPYSNYVHM